MHRAERKEEAFSSLGVRCNAFGRDLASQVSSGPGGRRRWRRLAPSMCGSGKAAPARQAAKQGGRGSHAKSFLLQLHPACCWTEIAGVSFFLFFSFLFFQGVLPGKISCCFCSLRGWRRETKTKRPCMNPALSYQGVINDRERERQWL